MNLFALNSQLLPIPSQSSALDQEIIALKSNTNVAGYTMRDAVSKSWKPTPHEENTPQLITAAAGPSSDKYTPHNAFIKLRSKLENMEH